jgi:hypothetical protein
VFGSQEQMKFVAVAEQPPREIRAHKSASSSQDDAFHIQMKVL